MLILEKNPKSVAAESYRTLRTNIQYSSFDNPVKSIVITSSEPGEGKSTTSANLALSFAQDGKRAITHYEVFEQYDKGVSLVKCTLETGRTHQIRVHMASIGHPLVGDLVYGYKRQKFNIEGQALHAKTLGFIHPRTNEYIEFTSELPKYFKELLEKLKNNVNNK